MRGIQTQTSSGTRKIRDAALAVLRRFGRMETTGGRTPARITRAELGEMQIIHNTPFTPQPQGPVSMQNVLEQAGRAILPYSPDAADVDLTRERLIP
jgi:hypothetical protein